MQLSHVLVVLAAAVATNAQLPDIPNCALTCFTTALTTDGCSSLTDFKCHCSKPQLIAQVTPCVQAACSAADQQKVAAAVQSTCAAAGVPISVPPVQGASTSSSGASSAPSSTPSSSAPVSTTASVVSTAKSTPTAGPTFSNSTGTTGGSGAGPSSSVVPFTGGASHIQGTVGGLAAFLVAAAYYL